jgi:Calpain family cysteine protease
MALDIKRVRNDFVRAASNGTISEKEVDSILKRVRSEGVTQSEARKLKAEAKNFSAQFSPQASQKLDAFIHTKMRGLQVLDDPTPTNPLGLKDPKVLPTDVKTTRQEVIAGSSLFINGISGNDVRQKYLGDCYLMAAMASVARVNPQLIERAFHKRTDGTYDVTIFKRHGSKFEPVKVHIDADLPHNDWYHLTYASGRDEKELWPALLEKAVAAHAGSYGKIEAGVPGDALSWLTGKPTTALDFHSAGVRSENVLHELEKALAEHRPATASTFGESSNAKYTNTGLYSDHAYSVWGIERSGGKTYVRLRNPWGDSEPEGNGRNDGIFKIEISEFMKLFANVEING